MEVDGSINKLAPAEFTDEGEGDFWFYNEGGGAGSDGDREHLLLRGAVSKEEGYLARAARFPHLTQTLVTFVLKAHVHSGSIDGNINSIRKSFTMLTLLSPHTSHCDKYTSLLNSSRSAEVEYLLN